LIVKATVRPGSLTTQVTERLRNAILDAEFKLGEALSEDKLATALKVSRTPVREALTALQLQGLIHIQPQRGSFVFMPSVADLAELCEFRCIIEVQALHLCFAHSRKAMLAQMRSASSAMAAARAAKDPLASARADSAFHESLLGNCQNHYLTEAYRLASGKVSALRAHSSTANVRTAANVEHEQIIKAVARNDLPAAEAILTDHILKMRQRYEPKSRQSATPRTADRRRQADESIALLDD